MKKPILPLLALMTAVLTGVHSQEIRWGKCPKVGVEQHFDLYLYMGKWHQWASYGTEAFQGKGKCAQAEYYLNRITGLVDVVNSQIPLNRVTKKIIRGHATYQNPKKQEGKFLVTLTVPVIGTVTTPLWVLGTDYISWSVAYTCLDFWVFHVTSSWILTRDAIPGDFIKKEVNAVIQKIKLTTDNYKKTDHYNCNGEAEVKIGPGVL